MTSSQSARRGVLLLNLGTPEQPQPAQVKKYLKEFLMDPWVIDIPFLFRWFLIHGIIVPRRASNSAQAYEKIWTQRGSPLLFHLMDLTSQVQVNLGSQWSVKPAMRYGQPSLEAALMELRQEGIQEIRVLPLYPQYSLAATESSIQESLRLAKKLYPQAQLTILPAFYNRQCFLDAFAAVAKEDLRGFTYDHLLFSFHGLPERHVKKTDPSKSHCLSSENCCEQIGKQNTRCYRAQCYFTANGIAQRLGVAPEKYTVCFQSRLGRTPWIRPYTDDFYRRLPSQGVRRLGVICPSFVADCLETLEEVQIRGQDEFIQNGGQAFKMVSSLNSTLIWSKAVAELVENAVQA
jgi:ferrochelatase